MNRPHVALPVKCQPRKATGRLERFRVTLRHLGAGQRRSVMRNEDEIVNLDYLLAVPFGRRFFSAGTIAVPAFRATSQTS
jgi:hypothetical protein